MKNITGLILILLFLVSCQGKQKTKSVAENLNFVQPDEFFVDSLNFGRKSNNKIELSLFKTDDSTYVVINVYSKQNEKWILKNQYEFEKDRSEEHSLNSSH